MRWIPRGTHFLAMLGTLRSMQYCGGVEIIWKSRMTGELQAIAARD
jgi:hypothetical protein